jgi:YD repeat-containing protein
MTSMTSGTTVVTMMYHAFGKRVSKTVTDTAAHTSVTTQYLVEVDVNLTFEP